MKKLITAATIAAILLATPSRANEEETHVGLFFGATLAAILVMGAMDDQPESD